jgi:dihydrofolate reductase
MVIFSMGVSLDGFIAGPGGDIGWSAPDDELHRFHNEQSRALSAELCGRRLYEEMLPWEREQDPSAPPFVHDFAAVWQALPKVVFSRTLSQVEGNARLASGSPAEEVAKLDGVIAVGGAGLAATFMQLDLIDEYRQFVSPVVLGAGTPYFPPLERRLNLELIETRTFGNRVVYLRYARVAESAAA